MPRSARTLQLNAEAHRLGDEYYRALSDALHSSSAVAADCIDRAYAYMMALEALRSHLSTLPMEIELDVLIRTTEGHISLVRNDLERFTQNHPVDPRDY